MVDTIKQLLTNQLEASLCTLHACVERCPDALWHAQVARYPFCQTAFHTLFFTDVYLGQDPEELQHQPYHLVNQALFADYEQMQDREPVTLYEREQIRSYLQFCRAKAVATIDRETAETLSEACRFPRRNCSRVELHVYNIRHIQHHAAQLILRLRQETNVDIPWMGHGWRNVTS